MDVELGGWLGLAVSLARMSYQPDCQGLWQIFVDSPPAIIVAESVEAIGLVDDRSMCSGLWGRESAVLKRSWDDSVPFFCLILDRRGD